MEELKNGLYITVKDIQILNGCSLKTAQRSHRTLRDALSKSSNKITVYEYCNYHDIDVNEVIGYLNKYR